TAHPGVLLGKRQAEQAELAHLRDNPVGELAALVEATDHRRHHGTREFRDGQAELVVFVTQPEADHLPALHRWLAAAAADASDATGRRAPRPPGAGPRAARGGAGQRGTGGLVLASAASRPGRGGRQAAFTGSANSRAGEYPDQPNALTGSDEIEV